MNDEGGSEVEGTKTGSEGQKARIEVQLQETRRGSFIRHPSSFILHLSSP